MKFMLLTPGTGHFYCGSCLRDNTLGKALRGLGHEVDVVPLYLPLVLEEGPEDVPVHMGGINMYLQQKTRLARHLPRWVANLLDRPALLRWASRRSNLTEAPDLGAMTVSMLRGEHGRQGVEIDKLVEWTVSLDRPDVILLSNIMLAGIARRLKEALDRPIVATLQGEAPFLDSLPGPYSEQSWRVLAERVADIDAFVPVSHSYGELMRGRLGLDSDRVRVIHNGLDVDEFDRDPPPLTARRPVTIGYLARMCRDKGLHTLVQAFAILKDRGSIEGLRLRVAGVMLAEDRPFVEDMKGLLQPRGWDQHAEFQPNVDRAEKLAFLQSLSVLSVPATYGESFGLYLLEAMVSGVPVVQPRHGAFPEILEATEGGTLCEPDDPASLADALEALLQDENRAQELATRGRNLVLKKFTAEHMAQEFENLCTMLASPHPAKTVE